LKDISALIDRYLAAYGEPDVSRRTQAINEIWAPDSRLIDPPLSAAGHAQIVAQADALLSQFPGHRFRRSSGIDAHHGFARYAWELLDPAGAVVLQGLDMAQADERGKLTQVVGFFGPLPALEPAT
jgi:hypothetical protein